MEIPTKLSLTVTSSSTSLILKCCLTFLLVSGCATDTSYDRHNKSRLWLSQDGKQLFFDASVSQAYPADDSAAEAARRSWLKDWLKLRKYCTEGYNVTERRDIRADEYNPQRHDLRYTIECH